MRVCYGITYRDMREFWNIFADEYFNGDKEKVISLQEKMKPYALMMYMTVVLSHPLMKQEYRKIYIEKVRNEVLSRCDEMMSFSWKI